MTMGRHLSSEVLTVNVQTSLRPHRTLHWLSLDMEYLEYRQEQGDRENITQFLSPGDLSLLSID